MLASRRPRWGCQYSKVKNLALHDEVMQGAHRLLDGSGVVPGVDVEDVDVVTPKLLERCINGDAQRLRAVASALGPLWKLFFGRVTLPARGIL